MKKISRKRAEIAISLIFICAVSSGFCFGASASQNGNWWYIISAVAITVSFVYGIIVIIRNIDTQGTDK